MKNKLFSIMLFILLIQLSTSSCFDSGSSITVINKSSDTVLVFASCSDSLEAGHDYSIYEKWGTNTKDSVTTYRLNRIEPDSIGFITFSGTHEQNIQKCLDKKLKIFFVKETTILNYPKEEIIKYQLYEKKLIFTQKELEKNDWTITYY